MDVKKMNPLEVAGGFNKWLAKFHPETLEAIKRTKAAPPEMAAQYEEYKKWVELQAIKPRWYDVGPVYDARVIAAGFADWVKLKHPEFIEESRTWRGAFMSPRLVALFNEYQAELSKGSA